MRCWGKTGETRVGHPQNRVQLIEIRELSSHQTTLYFTTLDAPRSGDKWPHCNGLRAGAPLA
jgi:hypothetical protein